MSTENVFVTQNDSEQQPAAPAEQAAPQVEPEVKPEAQAPDPNSLFADQLAQIKTEDGRQKYADVSTALDSISHAQKHIAELTKQKQELEAELQKRKGMEEMLDRINASQGTDTEQPSVNGLDEAALAELVNSAISQREKASIAQKNELEVSNGLRKKFGDKASDMLAAKAAELGVGLDFMQSLAQHSPKAVLSYFEGTTASDPTPVTGGINTADLPKPSAPNPLEEAKAKLMGQRDPLIEKWRSVAQTTN